MGGLRGRGPLHPVLSDNGGVPAVKRYLQAPKCGKCGSHTVLPIRECHRAGERGSHITLFCAACGEGSVGTEAELRQAERAQSSWRRQQEREEAEAKKASRHAEMESKLARLREDSW